MITSKVGKSKCRKINQGHRINLWWVRIWTPAIWAHSHHASPLRSSHCPCHLQMDFTWMQLDFCCGRRWPIGVCLSQHVLLSWLIQRQEHFESVCLWLYCGLLTQGWALADAPFVKRLHASPCPPHPSSAYPTKVVGSQQAEQWKGSLECLEHGQTSQDVGSSSFCSALGFWIESFPPSNNTDKSNEKGQVGFHLPWPGPAGPTSSLPSRSSRPKS